MIELTENQVDELCKRLYKVANAIMKYSIPSYIDGSKGELNDGKNTYQTFNQMPTFNSEFGKVYLKEAKDYIETLRNAAATGSLSEKEIVDLHTELQVEDRGLAIAKLTARPLGLKGTLDIQNDSLENFLQSTVNADLLNLTQIFLQDVHYEQMKPVTLAANLTTDRFISRAANLKPGQPVEADAVAGLGYFFVRFCLLKSNISTFKSGFFEADSYHDLLQVQLHSIRKTDANSNGGQKLEDLFFAALNEQVKKVTGLPDAQAVIDSFKAKSKVAYLCPPRTFYEGIMANFRSRAQQAGLNAELQEFKKNETAHMAELGKLLALPSLPPMVLGRK